MKAKTGALKTSMCTTHHTTACVEALEWVHSGKTEVCAIILGHQRRPGGLEPSGLGSWAQRQEGLIRACPVVVILVVPPLRRQVFLFLCSFSFSASSLLERIPAERLPCP